MLLCDLLLRMHATKLSFHLFNSLGSFTYLCSISILFLTCYFLLLKAYAVTAIMKICAFEISAGRKVELLPEVGCF